MKLVQEACLVNLITNSIFNRDGYESPPFTWERIGQHSTSFCSDFCYEDAQVLLQLSLMVGRANSEERPLDSPSWLEETLLVYNQCPSNIISSMASKSPANKSATLGHILYSKQANILFIVFTSTSNTCMAVLDLTYRQVELDDILNYVPGLRGHQGVYIAYQSIRRQLTKTIDKYLNNLSGTQPQIIICGNSLGGALSQVCALDLAFYNPIHYSFASPMVFNKIGHDLFTKHVKCSYRVANISDLVVILPLPVMPNEDAFYHVGKLIHFQRNLADYPSNHSLAYAQEFHIV
jgi:hypothetical protein